ncbi:MAG: reverse transcriptase domain-containing protein, partial [Legionella sp.]|uniref:reverse transcriptase domain-containing protein n=1 Tax=Legionella sp. TaxID=459 RepID=UPI0039E5F94B
IHRVRSRPAKMVNCWPRPHIEHYFDDPKVQSMLTNIIKNPIDTPWGTINPDNGISLRGPLSQLFSALYLKPLDDALTQSEVFYLRYQDDVIVCCKSKRQLNRCKQKVMDILKERKLSLSRKKSRIGLVSQGFHFLGVNYLETQPQDNTRNACAFDTCSNNIHNGGGG